MLDTAFSSKSMPKTKEGYIRSHGKVPSDLIKTPERAKAMPKQTTHTVTRNVSTGAKKAVKTKDSLLKGTNKAVKTSNSYVGKSVKKKAVKSAKRAAKTQKEITKKAAKQAAKQAKEVAQKSAQAAKATAKAAVKIAVKVAQMVAAAAKAIVSALAALGGWAVLLVALIVVIVVAANSEKVVYITITAKTKEKMIEKYHFTRKQQEALNTILEQDEVLISATQSLAVSDRAAQDILKNLPDSLSAERKKVIKAACSLVGKVNYFWGGKSSAIGWDSEWGKLKTVSAEGSKTTGTKRPFGLDCSGFVTWSFINSGFNASAIGHGTQGQIAKCSRISRSNAQAGDLAFYADLSHVGIVAGKDADGNILVIRCSSGGNNVVITTNSGFGFAARPRRY